MEDAVGNRRLCQVKVGMTPRSEFDLRVLIFVCSVGRCYSVVALTYDTHEEMGTACVYEGWNFNSGNYLFITDTK